MAFYLWKMEHPIQISIFDSCDILGITRASKSTADELTLKSGKDDQLNSVMSHPSLHATIEIQRV